MTYGRWVGHDGTLEAVRSAARNLGYAARMVRFGA